MGENFFVMHRRAYIVIFLLICIPPSRAADAKTEEHSNATCPLSTNFTWSYPSRYSLTNEKYYEHNALSEICDEADEFTSLVRSVTELSSSHPTNKIHPSILQQLMVRGFQLLCLWTQPLKQRFKLIDELKSSTRPSPIADVRTTSQNYILRLSNLTMTGFPTQHEKLSTNPTDPSCSTNYETYYEADSQTTKICGIISLNDTSTGAAAAPAAGFMLIYGNAAVTMNEIKTRTRKAPIILTKRIREHFQFENCTAQSTDDLYLNASTVLELITPALMEEIFKTDPTRRLAYVSLSHDVKIAESYKQTVLRLTSNVLVEYLRSEYTASYHIPASYLMVAEIERIQLVGLHLVTACGSNMRIVRRENHLLMKLLFSLRFRNDTNGTAALMVKRRDFHQFEAISIKKLNVRLEFSSSIEGRHNFSFQLVGVRAQIVDEYSIPWYQQYAHKMNAVLGEILKEIILTWILYETN